MKRIPRMRWMVAAAFAAWLCVGAPAFGVGTPGGPAPLARGWGRVLASGTIASLDRAHGRFQFDVAGSGRVDWFEGGTVWRQAPLTGAHTVRLLPATALLNADGQALPPGGVRPGASAALWGVARPGTDVVALTIEVAPGPGSAAAPAALAAAQAGESRRGVVVSRSGTTIVLLSAAGIARSVVVSATTAVTSGGRAASGTSIGPDDVLQVAGPVNSDGSIVATGITIAFSAATAARVAGPVEQRFETLGGLIVAGTMVSTSADTYALHDGAGATLSDAAPGRLVVVYGVPVRDGATPVGLAARVIVLR